MSLKDHFFFFFLPLRYFFSFFAHSFSYAHNVKDSAEDACVRISCGGGACTAVKAKAKDQGLGSLITADLESTQM